MATSLPSVSLKHPDEWVDLFSATAIAVGTEIIMQNTGKSTIHLTESSAEPVLNAGFNVILPGQFVILDAGNIGAWAMGKHPESYLQVEVS